MSKKVYADANFLVAYFVEGHIKNDDSVKKMAELLTDKCKFCVSTLALDETWHIIHKYYKSGREYRSHFSEFESIFNKMKDSKNFSFIQFASLTIGITKALENIDRFNLRPRDSFHLAMAEDQRADLLITCDSDLTKIQNSPVRIEAF